MKIGDRVRLSPGISPILDRRYGVVRGVLIGFYNDTCAKVKWDHGVVSGYHISFLTVDLPFPYHSHRTIAEVDADEQKPEPA